MKTLSIIAFLVIGLSSLTNADSYTSYPARPDRKVDTVTLPAIFTDRMVLQRNQPVRVWGWAPADQEITVEFAGQKKSTQTDSNGNWKVLLDAMDASFTNRSLIVKGGDKTLTVNEVLVGEVWLCGGQSNMEFKLRNSTNGDLEVSSAVYEAIRYLRVPHVANTNPQADFVPQNGEGTWRKCLDKESGDCTAVGYFFGRRIHQYIKVPVGLIDTSWGGTMAQHWVEHSLFEGIKEMDTYLEEFAKKQKEWVDMGREEGAKKQLEKDIAEWEKKVEEWRSIKDKTKKSRRPPGKPKLKTDPVTHHQPSGMLNGLVAPIAGYGIRGVLFYQGENNSFGEGWKPYYKTFRKVIETHRKAFDDNELPFGIIQIAGWSNRRRMPYDMNHHTNVIREVQFDVWQSTPNTGLIVSFDANTDGNIHPRFKTPLGERSARWALAEVYDVKDHNGRKIQWMGPIYDRMEIKDGKAIIYFKGDANGIRLNKDVDVGFVIAGEDKVFKVAKARRHSNNSIQVWHEEIENPAAVRYSQSNLPMGMLLNGRELPAYPFRTDDWPLTPHHSKGQYIRSESQVK